MSNEVANASSVSLLSNIALAAVKVVVGVVGSSYALIADGIESLGDTLSSLVVWKGIRVGAKRPDPDHPYGHGKAEAIASFIAGVGLLFSGLLIAIQAVREITTPQSIPAAFTVPVLIAIIAIKEFLFRYLSRKADRFDSSVLLAEAWHHRSDSLTSLCVLFGLSIAVFAGPGFGTADDIAALLVTGLIVRNGWRILRPAVDELMDRRILGDRYDRLYAAIESTDGVKGIETLWLRRSGSRFHVDIHLEVDPEITVREGHEIAHRVKDRLQGLKDIEIQHVGTHVEPHP